MFGQVVTNRFSRLEFDTSNVNASVIDISLDRTANIRFAEVLLIIGAFQPIESTNLIDQVACTTEEDPDVISQLLLNLIYYGFINIENQVDDQLDTLSKIRHEWDEMGWAVNFDYILSSLDLPFLGGDKDGLEQAAETMRRYAAESSDNDRVKQFTKINLKTSLPSISDLLNTIKPPNSWSLGFRLKALASCTVSPIKVTQPKWGGAPLFRKLHPSGGSRHPTEAYLMLPDTVEDIKSGYYHIQVDPLELVSLQVSSTEITLQTLEPLVNRVPFKVEAALILTSCFKRNRYRYRESRTYRTVHLDIGHILSNIELLAQSLSLSVFVTYTWDTSSSEVLTGTNYLEEGILAIIFIGNNIL